MKSIKDPKEKNIKEKTTCALVSRMPRDNNSEFKTAVIRLYKINNAHKTQELPIVQYEFTNIEKIRIVGLNTSYYLEGNDIVINDLEEIYIVVDGTKITLKGYQHLVEKRTKK